MGAFCDGDGERDGVDGFRDDGGGGDGGGENAPIWIGVSAASGIVIEEIDGILAEKSSTTGSQEFSGSLVDAIDGMRARVRLCKRAGRELLETAGGGDPRACMIIAAGSCLASEDTPNVRL